MAAAHPNRQVRCAGVALGAQGDNTIMTLQTGRYLINCYRDAKSGAKLPEGVAYLNNFASLRGRRAAARTLDDIVRFDVLLETYDIVCANLVVAVGERYEKLVAGGANPEVAYEECGAAAGRE